PQAQSSGLPQECPLCPGSGTWSQVRVTGNVGITPGESQGTHLESHREYGNTPGGSQGRPESWQPPLPQWTNAQISEHYSTCIKLSTENKITTKNAFVLHLIDYMTDILKEKNSELTNFQVAAGTLDASAKIYAVRVDSVHADAFRVLGHLGKEPAPAKDMDSPEEAESVTQKAQPRKKQSFKTIEQNLSNINVSEAGRRAEVDPMFQRAAASFDECNTAGIFLSGLHSQSFQSRLLFPSGIVPLPSSESPALPSTDPVTVASLKALLAPCLEKRRICSSLAGFQFTKWDEESHNESVSALLEKFRKSEQVFDPNVDPDRITSPGNSAGILSSSHSFSRSNGAPFGEGDIGTLSLHVSLNPGEYSYFSPRTLSMWAGPEHWRFRPRPEKDSRRKLPRKVFELDFQEDIDFPAHFRKTKASITLAKSILESQNIRSTTLPADFNYDPQNMVQLFLKPLVKVRAGIEDYDYDNPNDTSNFCPAPQVQPRELPAGSSAGKIHGQRIHEGRNWSSRALQAGLGHSQDRAPGIPSQPFPCPTEEGIPSFPAPIHKIPIHYAKTAKKMDMRRLKRNMWELLTEQGTQGEDAGEGTDTEVAGEKILSDVTKDLLHRLPPAMATNLSVPLAFVCLLHLANEKNLRLESTEDLSDILVKQGH
uniref:Condensin complex subunit 2 n=1 Tax=Zosterops lateralis melanops TaxID=1220523 RepID=A0A8D2PT81_ZOSLA